MKIRKFTAIAAVVVAGAMGAFATAGADAPLTVLGEFTVGETVFFPFECPNDGNDFFLFMGDSKIDEFTIDASADYLLGFPLDTTGFEPGEYSAGIECFESEGIFDYEFTIVAADPCAPVDTVEVPKGPSRAPHGAPIECQDSGIPLTGSSDTSTIMLLGTVAIVAGTGLLIARRRTLA